MTSEHKTGPYKTTQIAALRRQLRSAAVDNAAVDATTRLLRRRSCDVLIEKCQKFTPLLLRHSSTAALFYCGAGVPNVAIP